MTDSRSSYLSAAECFVAQVAAIPVDALSGPGLGDWDLRSLVGHTSRSLVTVDSYLDQPAASVAVPTAADYYLAIAAALGAADPAIVERGRQAGATLGEDPATYVGDLATRVGERLASYDDGYVLTSIAGGMRLDEYLRTRTFELVVHGLDIAAACGIDPAFDESPLVDAATLAAEVAVRSERGPELLMAVTGRTRLREDFSIV
jgi:mycothiol maleylpyruvate isomerase-like protein